MLVFIAYIVGLEKLAKILVLIQRLLKAAEDAVVGEAGRGINWDLRPYIILIGTAKRTGSFGAI